MRRQRSPVEKPKRKGDLGKTFETVAILAGIRRGETLETAVILAGNLHFLHFYTAKI